MECCIKMLKEIKFGTHIFNSLSFSLSLKCMNNIVDVVVVVVVLV